MNLIKIIVTALFVIGGIALVATVIKYPRGVFKGIFIGIPHAFLSAFWDLVLLILIPIWWPIWFLDYYLKWGLFKKFNKANKSNFFMKLRKK